MDAGAGLVAYASAKTGVMQVGRSLALELAPTGVTVNLIAPGTIETDFNRAALADPGYTPTHRQSAHCSCQSAVMRFCCADDPPWLP